MELIVQRCENLFVSIGECNEIYIFMYILEPLNVEVDKLLLQWVLLQFPLWFILLPEFYVKV
jgi:hypothetical protein